MTRREPDEGLQQELLLRLDIIAALLLDSPAAEDRPSTTAKILRLLSLGFSPAQTASIVKRPTNYVSAVVAESKKRKAKSRTSG